MSRSPKAFHALGPVLRKLRIERGLTQAQLADRAGVSKSMLSLYERDRQRPHLDTLERLLDALGTGLGGLVMRLEAWRGSEEHPAAQRGPRRRPPDPAASGTSLEKEAMAAAAEVLQGIATLLEQALQSGPARGGAPPAAGPPRHDDKA